MTVEAIFNYARRTDKISTSGQPGVEEFCMIADVGFTTVVNLAMHNSEGAIPNEGHHVALSGMSYFHLPVPFEAPTAKHLRLFIQLMEILKDEKVWVHCAKNYRVSAFMFVYFNLVRGYAAAEAMSPIFKHWKTDVVWQQLMKLNKDEIGL